MYGALVSAAGGCGMRGQEHIALHHRGVSPAVPSVQHWATKVGVNHAQKASNRMMETLNSEALQPAVLGLRKGETRDRDQRSTIAVRVPDSDQDAERLRIRI